MEPGSARRRRPDAAHAARPARARGSEPCRPPGGRAPRDRPRGPAARGRPPAAPRTRPGRDRPARGTSARRGGRAPAGTLASRLVSVVHVEQLTKTYVVPEREAGLAAAMRALVRRRHREVQAVESISFEI